MCYERATGVNNCEVVEYKRMSNSKRLAVTLNECSDFCQYCQFFLPQQHVFYSLFLLLPHKLLLGTVRTCLQISYKTVTTIIGIAQTDIIHTSNFYTVMCILYTLDNFLPCTEILFIIVWRIF